MVRPLKPFLSVISRFPLIKQIYRLYRNGRAQVNNPTLRIYSGVSIRNCRIEEFVTIYQDTSVQNCSIGRMTYIQSECILINCSIGRFCSIAHDVKAGLGMHPTNGFVSTHPAFYSSLGQAQITFTENNLFNEFQGVDIGNDVLIGVGVIILDGVRIGSGAVIAAGAVVTKDVAPYSVVAGIPARMIKFRFSKDQIDLLLKYEWWKRDLAWIRINHESFASANSLIKLLAEASDANCD